MEYIFDEEMFIKAFNAKGEGDGKSMDSMRLTHRADNAFKLFPYKASGKAQAPIVTELGDVVSAFFREILNKKIEPICFESLYKDLLEEVEMEDEDRDYFKDLLQNMFFDGENFVANSFGLYPYQTMVNNKSVDNLAHFLYSVFGVNDEDFELVKKAKEEHHFNVLENLIIQSIESNKVKDADKKTPYFSINTDVQEKFRNDFHFMLTSGMTTLEDFSNLFSIYYFYYVSKTCITLDRFCDGKRDEEVKFYFALDWEKVSKNRECCSSGWDKLQEKIGHMFSHAITLEILNQTKGEEMIDYITFGNYIKGDVLEDKKVADEIRKAERTYRSYVGDYKEFEKISEESIETETETEKAIKHLYKCVEKQFLYTDRNRANQFYNEKFSEFCKSRWIKNRRKSGLVLNLTERDIIFLTKISIQNKEKIRLKELFMEYEYRGIFLDNTSKEHLQEFFTKLNLIDKKSDSGDAQYVKRIL